MTLRSDNARAVADYMEFRPSMLESSTQISEEPFDRKARGGTRPPVPNRAFDWMEGGVGFNVIRGDLEEPVTRFQALKYQGALNAIIESYRNGIEKHSDVKWSEIANELWSNPTCVRAWYESLPNYADAFRALCMRIAGDFDQIYPNVRIVVEISEKARLARRKTREAQKLYTLQVDTKIVRSLKEIEQEHRCSRKAAIGLLIDRTEYSAPKIRKAIERVNREGAA